MCLIGKMQLLCMQCRGIGPHLVVRGKSHGFSRVAAGTGVYSRVTKGMSIRNSSLFIEVRNLSRYEGQLRNVNYAWQVNWELEVKWEFSSLFLFEIVILGCLTILKNFQASSKLEAVNSTWLSSCQRHVRSLFEMRRRPKAFRSEEAHV